jgi:hypothetical protein
MCCMFGFLCHQPRSTGGTEFCSRVDDWFPASRALFNQLRSADNAVVHSLSEVTEIAAMWAVAVTVAFHHSTTP